MKILSLTFSNLNSLKGKWHIDFTNDSFVNDGIFAITGQTGSGKTTILDAICLAIYGKTPRINVISNTHNELMSIDRWYCHSEVVVLISTSSGDKIYRFSFEQRRAGKKPDGKLQPIKREISQLAHINDDGKIIETKPSLCDKKTKEIMHMSFEQFTRSVMLAQGNFAAFLTADANEKGEILEQITGTDIYAKISQKTFEAHKQKKENLTQLEKTLSEHTTITDEEFFHLQHLINTADDNIEYHKKILKNINENIQFVQQKNQAEQEIKNIKHKIDIVKNDILSFADQSLLLKQSQKAKNLQPIYQELTKEQTIEINTKNTLDDLHQQFLNSKKELVNITSQLDNQSIIIANQKKHQQEAASLFRQVREIDIKINHRKNNLDKINLEITSYQNFILTGNDNISHLIENKEKLSNDITHHEEFLNKFSNNNINQDLGALKAKYSHLHENFQYTTKIHQNLIEQNQEIYIKTQEITKKREILVKKREILLQQQEISKELEVQIRKTLQNIINDDSIKTEQIFGYGVYFQEKINTINQKQSLLNSLKKDSQYYQDIENQIFDLKERIYHANQNKSEITKHIEGINQALNNEHKTLSALHQHHELYQELLILKQYHQKLHDNEPCPLCGSLQHPYAQKNPFIYEVCDDNNQAIAHTSQKIEQLTDKRQQLNDSLIATENDIMHLTKQCDDLSVQKDEIFENIRKAYINILPTNYGNHKLLNIQNHINDLDQDLKLELSLTTKNYHDFKNLSNLLLKNNQNIEKINQEIDIITQDGKHIKSQIDILNHDIHQKQDDILNTKEKTQEIIHQINQILPSYQIPCLIFNDTILDDIHQNIQTLSEISEKVHNTNQQKHDFEIQFNQIITRIESEKNLILDYEKKLSKISIEANYLRDDINQQINHRHEIFGNKNVDDEEKALNLELENSQLMIDTINKKYQNQKQSHHLLNEKINHHKELLQNTLNNIKNLSNKLNELLNTHEFHDIDEFLSYCLDDNEISNLQKQEQELHYQLKNLEENHKYWNNHLNQLLSNHQDVINTDFDQLTLQKEQLQHQYDELLTEFGKKKQKLTGEIAIRKKQQSIIEEINRHKEELNIWAKLDELIGSKEGSKYRNFVQGLTLEFMLYHANEILEKMDNRYVLTHDDNNKNPLSISIIDTAQGGEIRSTKNLSGGESFIISLALALGLSKMSSDNMNIGSLFLDEGFGTLDNEALDIALSTLSSLQETGKTIGIISHVQSLKERIPTQIQVKKIANGESMLIGNGIRQICP